MSELQMPEGDPLGVVAVYFGFAEGAEADAAMEAIETERLAPTIAYLRENGFAVLVKGGATAEDFKAFVSGGTETLGGHDPVALLWSGHGGPNGSLQTHDDSPLHPAEMADVRVHSSFRLAIFSSCHTGVHARAWHKALDGRPTVVGYDGLARFGDVVEFYSAGDSNDNQLPRLLRTYLLNPALSPLLEPAAEALR